MRHLCAMKCPLCIFLLDMPYNFEEKVRAGGYLEDLSPLRASNGKYSKSNIFNLRS